MDILLVIVCLVLLVLVVQAVRLIFADGDLSLMWAAKYGHKPAVLAGQVVWITGSSSGIGEYLAYELAKAGCKLVLSARSIPQLEAVKKKCLTCGHLREEDILVLPLDVTDIPSHKNAVDKVIATFGQIDILVNNAGRAQRAWIVDTELAVDREMIELNVIGQVSLTKCVLPHMIERKRGHIAVTSSISGKSGMAYSASYCITKFAINGFFQSLAVEMHTQNIGVTIVCPGPILSNISQVAFTGVSGKQYGQGADKGIKRMPTERCAELFSVAIANKLDEVWICPQPVLTLMYAAQYLPSISFWIAKRVGAKAILKVHKGR